MAKRKTHHITIFDCETGGLSAKEHPITQIALRTVRADNFELVNEFETNIKPYGDLEITEKALEVSMVSKRELASAPESKEVLKVLIEFFKQSRSSKTGRVILAGHNAAFDIAFLKAFFVFHGKDLSDHVRHNNGEILYHCTQRMAEEAWVEDDERVNLTNCCKRIGVDLIDAHGAMADVKATMSLLYYFLKGLRSEGNNNPEKAAEELEKQGKLRYAAKPFQF